MGTFAREMLEGPVFHKEDNTETRLQETGALSKCTAEDGSSADRHQGNDNRKRQRN